MPDSWGLFLVSKACFRSLNQQIAPNVFASQYMDSNKTRPLAMFTILMAVSINCYLDFSTHISGYLGKIFEMPPDLSTASEVSLKTWQFPRCHPHCHLRRHKLGCHGHSFSRKCRIWMSTTYFRSATSVPRFLDSCRS